MTQIETAPYYRRYHDKNRKKKNPPSLEPPQLGFLMNLLGRLSLRDDHFLLLFFGFFFFGFFFTRAPLPCFEN